MTEKESLVSITLCVYTLNSDNSRHMFDCTNNAVEVLFVKNLDGDLDQTFIFF